MAVVVAVVTMVLVVAMVVVAMAVMIMAVMGRGRACHAQRKSSDRGEHDGEAFHRWFPVKRGLSLG